MKDLARRRLEASALVLIAAALLALDTATIALAYSLLLGVLLLLRRNLNESRRVVAARDREGVEQLLIQGMNLYRRCKQIGEQRKSWEQSRDFALVNYEIEKWVDRVRTDLQPYPEFVGIFNAGRNDKPRIEFRDRIRRLAEIKRLIVLNAEIGPRNTLIRVENLASTDTAESSHR